MAMSIIGVLTIRQISTGMGNRVGTGGSDQKRNQWVNHKNLAENPIKATHPNLI
jgi:hypothetical protein